MAQSENMRKLHAAQDAFATESFQKYKETIARKFIDEFGGSYQTYENIGDKWRNIYKYAITCEDFLKMQTIVFLGTLPDKNGMCRNPRFLKNLIAKISEYLSVYVAKQFDDPSKERNKCTRDLIEYFVEHRALKRMMRQFQQQKEREWGKKRKAEREERKVAKQSKKPRDRRHPNAVPVVLQRTQIEKLDAKSVRTRIRVLQDEVAQFEISIRTIHSK